MGVKTCLQTHQLMVDAQKLSKIVITMRIEKITRRTLSSTFKDTLLKGPLQA